jgi:hypothetical protein
MADTGFINLQPQGAKRFDINSSSSTIDVQAPSVSTKSIRILSLCLSVGAVGALTFQSNTTVLGHYTWGAAATDLGLVLNRNADGWFQCAAGQDFKIGNAGTLAVTGFGVYVEI